MYYRRGRVLRKQPVLLRTPVSAIVEGYKEGVIGIRLISSFYHTGGYSIGNKGHSIGHLEVLKPALHILRAPPCNTDEQRRQVVEQLALINQDYKNNRAIRSP